MPSFTYFFCVVARLTSTSSLNQVLLFFFSYQTYVDTVRIGEVGPW